MDITKLKIVSQFWKTKSLILWQIYPGCFIRIKGHIMVKVNNLTWLSTISSARISLMVHPPPMRNEIFLPTIRKQGDMRVPRGASGSFEYCRPAGSFSLVRFSAPPPYPPVPLLLCAFSVACCWIITKCWLVNESCACHFPSTNSIFKVKTASWWERKKRKCLSRGILNDYHSMS